MSQPFMGEIKIISWNFAPQNWAFCNGQLLPINQNQALFSLLGTTYGGNGQTTFALPDFRGRIPVHVGNGHLQGEAAGESSHTLIMSEMPTHPHGLQGTNNSGTAIIPTGNVLGTTPNQIYTQPASLTTLEPSSVSNFGGSQPHENRQPYLVLNFIIALLGIFPSRN
jgi:microcystin-dependent protein